MQSNTLARDALPPITLPPDKTLLDMFYYMKLTRELEFRIERKLYRQGKIVGGVYVGRGQEAIAVGSCIDLRQDDLVCRLLLEKKKKKETTQYKEKNK